MTMVNRLLKSAIDRLAKVGIDSPRFEAEILLAWAAQVEKSRLLQLDCLNSQMINNFEKAIQQRLSGCPISYIQGKREFFGLELEVRQGVLIPRADSEIIVESALEHIKSIENPMILDIGVGSGALLLALLDQLPTARGIGVDRSSIALEVAQRNFQRLLPGRDVTLIESDWCERVRDQKFDLVLSNPPYIPTHQIAQLDRTVREFEPLIALDGGEDGLKCYRAIKRDLKQIMKPGAIAVFEVGFDQSRQVIELLQSSSLQLLSIRKDLQGIERALAFTHRNHTKASENQ